MFLQKDQEATARLECLKLAVQTEGCTEYNALEIAQKYFEFILKEACSSTVEPAVHNRSDEGSNPSGPTKTN
jgi:hypothetical protein